MLRQRAARVTMRRCVTLSKKNATRQTSTFVGNAGNTVEFSTHCVRSMLAVTSMMCCVAHRLSHLYTLCCQEAVRAALSLAMVIKCLSFNDLRGTTVRSFRSTLH